MPFTLAHAAAAMPFRQTRLILSALIVGTFAPDFEYFFRLSPKGRLGHTVLGVFVLDLPLALLVLWLFHAYMKEPLVALLPDSVQRRIDLGACTFRFWGPTRLAIILGSILLGVGTHIIWDSFTHPTFWLYRHWTVLSQTASLPILGTVQFYKLFQHISTVVGGAVLLIWLTRWYRITTPNKQVRVGQLSVAEKRWFVVLLPLITLLGALVRAFVGVGIPKGSRSVETFVVDAVVAAVALIWIQLLVMGIAWSTSDKSHRQS